MGGARLPFLVAGLSIAAALVLTPLAPPARSTVGTAAGAGIASLALPTPRDAKPVASANKGAIETRTLWSSSLGRTMPYRIYLPASYASGTRRYPVLYLLHGMAASDDQWEDLGVGTVADELIASGAIAPLIIVMPEGENSYWVDHATDGQKWGRYAAVDVVGDVDATFRSIATARSRAIGGLSMGAHGALQLALNYPDRFGAVGAHSLVLRRFGSAPAFFGGPADFASRDPMQLVRSKACPFALWIDIGSDDPWAATAVQFDRELTDLGVRHEWHLWSGGHSASYWTAHLGDYLRFYARSFSAKPVRSAIS
ncbi:MAG: hypothetical protein E6J13_10530 [Chloroflexi bacterium]|nr:MAG: hypothetical protein E6J13_10530 [Chloroflexota bacterium]